MEGVEVKLALALGRPHLGAWGKKNEHLGRVVAEPNFPDLLTELVARGENKYKSDTPAFQG